MGSPHVLHLQHRVGLTGVGLTGVAQGKGRLRGKSGACGG